MTHSFPNRRSSDLVQVAIANVADHVAAAGWPAALEACLYFGNVRRHVADRQTDVVQKDRLTTIQRREVLVNLPECTQFRVGLRNDRSEEHTSELQSLMRISYAVFCLKKKKQ